MPATDGTYIAKSQHNEPGGIIRQPCMNSAPPPQHRGVIYRLVPGSQANARRLHSIAFGCRFAWNRILAESQEAYRRHCDTERFSEDTLLGLLYERPARPSVSFFSLSKAFTRLRQENPWLQALPYGAVRAAWAVAMAWLLLMLFGAGRPW